MKQDRLRNVGLACMAFFVLFGLWSMGSNSWLIVDENVHIGLDGLYECSIVRDEQTCDHRELSAGSIPGIGIDAGVLAIFLALVIAVRRRRSRWVVAFVFADGVFFLCVVYFLVGFPIVLSTGHAVMAFMTSQILAVIGATILWPGDNSYVHEEVLDMSPSPRSGPRYVYDTRGKLSAIEQYQDGELISCTEYDEHARPKPKRDEPGADAVDNDESPRSDADS